MVIAIDLDGVVFDTEEYFRTYAHLYDLENVKNGLIGKSEMDMHKRHNWDNEVTNDFYQKYTECILDQAPIKPGAKYVINQLKKQGHKLVCVTLRGYYHDYEISITEKRLKQEGIEFDKIVYNQHNKLDVCKSLGVGIMLEDNAKNVKILSKNKIKCLYFRANGLKKVKNKNVIEVQNWAQVLEYVKNNY